MNWTHLVSAEDLAAALGAPVVPEVNWMLTGSRQSTPSSARASSTGGTCSPSARNSSHDRAQP